MNKYEIYAIIAVVVIGGLISGVSITRVNESKQIQYQQDANPMDITCSKPTSSMQVEVCVAYFNSLKKE